MFYLIQAGTSLQAMDDSGTIVTLTLPSGVTISSARKGQSAILGRQIFFVYAGSINLWIVPEDLEVRAMGLQPPSSNMTLALGSGTGLTGKYTAAYSFAIKDADGVVVNESPASPVSNEFNVTNQALAMSSIDVSTNALVNCRRIYRTAGNGAVRFLQQDIDDNVTTAINTTLSDQALSLLPQDVNIQLPPGTAPGSALRIITEWKGRLWAVSEAAFERDDVIYTEPAQFFAWAGENVFPISPGEDAFGIVGFLRRRDSLGLVKRSRVVKMAGSTETGFEPILVTDKIGGCARDSCVVIRDVGYFLGLDGVYKWDDDGVRCISRPVVDPWFTSDTYFNRARFPNAFASYNPKIDAYVLNLAAAGSSVENRWIAVDIKTDRFFGPHLTTAFTPSARELVQDDDAKYFAAVGGSDGYVFFEDRTTPSDFAGAAPLTAIAISSSAREAFQFKKNPKINHFWGQLSMLTRVESGGTLTITPYLGGVDAAAGTALSHDLTTGYERLGRIGTSAAPTGRLLSLEFSQATAGRRWLIYGYDIEPGFEVGWR